MQDVAEKETVVDRKTGEAQEVFVSLQGLKSCLSFVSKDISRGAVHSVCVYKDGSLCATDGHRLLRVQPTGFDPENFPKVGSEPSPAAMPLTFPLLLDMDTVKSILKAAPKASKWNDLASVCHIVQTVAKGIVAVMTNGDGVAEFRFQPFDGDFPEVGQVFPSEVPTFKIAFDVAYLADLKSIVPLTNSFTRQVVLEFYGSDKAMRFSIPDTETDGLIMPLRLKD